MPLIIAGRNPSKAETFARRLPNTRVAMLDVGQPGPLKGIKPRAILAVVNDPQNYLLMDAIREGIPYVDITRWTLQVKVTLARIAAESFRAPVMFASGWMAGIAAVVAVANSRQFRSVDRIDMGVLYSLKDKAGPNSVEYLDRLATPFEVMLNGELKQVFPYTDPRKIIFPCGYSARAYRFDTPDQLTLPITTSAKTVTSRIAFNSATVTWLLVMLTRSGIWKLISGHRFTSIRRSLLYNPGQGASHEIVIETTGMNENDDMRTIRATLVDPKGQTHLTALGALVQLERVLGLDDAPPPAPGIVYPDTDPQIDSALKLRHNFGVDVT